MLTVRGGVVRGVMNLKKKNVSKTLKNWEFWANFQTDISARWGKVTQKFLCVILSTIGGYYPSRFGSLGPSNKIENIPIFAQLWRHAQFVKVVLKFSK